jgi:hypothetical protein
MAIQNGASAGDIICIPCFVYHKQLLVVVPVPEEVQPVMGVEQLLQVILEDPGAAKSNSRLSRISLEDVKRVAASRGTASSRFSKSKAVDAIVESVRLVRETKTAIQASASGALQRIETLLPE